MEWLWLTQFRPDWSSFVKSLTDFALHKRWPLFDQLYRYKFLTENLQTWII